MSSVEPWFISSCVGVLSYGETPSLAVEREHGVDEGWDTAHQQLCGDPAGKAKLKQCVSHLLQALIPKKVSACG